MGSKEGAARYRIRQRARVAAGDPTLHHGVGLYRAGGCRCPVCKAAQSAARTESRRYRVVYRPNHPLAQHRAQGNVEEHRVVLYDEIGPGPHQCHWCGMEIDWWADGAAKLQADHVNDDHHDNRPENLVPSCRGCNTHRGQPRHRVECVAPGCDTQVIEDTDGIRHLLTGTRTSSR